MIKLAYCLAVSRLSMADCKDLSIMLNCHDGFLCLQLKYYSRDFLIPGRVRIQLFRPDGKPINAAIPNRKLFFLDVWTSWSKRNVKCIPCITVMKQPPSLCNVTAATSKFKRVMYGASDGLPLYIELICERSLFKCPTEGKTCHCFVSDCLISMNVLLLVHILSLLNGGILSDSVWLWYRSYSHVENCSAGAKASQPIGEVEGSDSKSCTSSPTSKQQ